MISASLCVPALAAGYGNSYGSYRVGDYLYFGSYEQDGNTRNGTEPILWQVVETFSTCIKVVSAQVLDSRSYNSELWNVPWSDSEIRKWLNGTFYNSAFSANEQYLIELALVHNTGYNGVETTDDTYDNVLLLGYSEAKAYFKNDDQRLCRPTEYAKQSGAYVHSSYGTSWWWMRSEGEGWTSAMYVGSEGNIDMEGNPVNWGQGGVRPCIHISTTRSPYTYSGTVSPTSTPSVFLPDPGSSAYGYSYYGGADGSAAYIYCSACGKRISAESNYCMYCGHKVEWAGK